MVIGIDNFEKKNSFIRRGANKKFKNMPLDVKGSKHFAWDTWHCGWSSGCYCICGCDQGGLRLQVL